MTSNAEAAELLRAIADLLDLKGERFKPEAYRRAARSLDGLGEDLRSVAGRAELDAIPGVGAAIAEKLREYLREGRIPYLDRLATEVPPGILALLKVPGLGPKTVRRFWMELGVQGPTELAAAIDAGRLNGVQGFGPTKIRQIRTALDARPAGPRMPLLEATVLAQTLVEGITAAVPVERIEIAGSLRRARETVGDLDLLVISGAADAVFDAVTRLPGVASVVLRGPTKETVLLDTGVQVDVRVLLPDSFGAAWQYFTGSKDHNVRLRSLARDHGLKINEYAVYRGEEAVAGATEEEVYRSLGLSMIPPELREDHGEIEAAGRGPLPPVVQLPDLRGDLHVELPEGAGPEALEAVRRSAASAGHAYVGAVLPAAIGLTEVQRFLEARTALEGGPRLLLGLEVPAKGLADPRPPGIEYRVLVGGEGPPPAEVPPSPGPVIVAHLAWTPPGRSDADPGLAGPWLRWAEESKVALELPATAGREGLDSALARSANARGIPIFVSGRSVGTVDVRRLGVAVALARRAGLGADRVRNTSEDPFGGPTGLPRTPNHPPRSERSPRGSAARRRS
jgi:DNA polymerase (family 10)